MLIAAHIEVFVMIALWSCWEFETLVTGQQNKHERAYPDHFCH